MQNMVWAATFDSHACFGLPDLTWQLNYFIVEFWISIHSDSNRSKSSILKNFTLPTFPWIQIGDLLQNFIMEMKEILSSQPRHLIKSPPNNVSHKIFTLKAVSAFRRFISWKQVTQSVLCEFIPTGESRTEIFSLAKTKSYRKIAQYYFSVIFAAIYALYLVLQLIYRLHYCSSSVSQHRLQCNVVDTLWTFLWGAYFSWSTGNYVNAIKKDRDAVRFISGMVRLDNNFAGG